MIHLSSREVRDDNHTNGDVEIKYIGRRPSDKLYEVLLIGDEVSVTEHVRIIKASESVVSRVELDKVLQGSVKKQRI